MDLKIFGFSCRLEVIIICLVIGFILGAHLLCSCSKIGLQEGMAMMGSSLDWDMGEGQPTSWTSKGDEYAKSMGYSDTTSKYAQYQGTPVPLPEGQMFMFADNKFKYYNYNSIIIMFIDFVIYVFLIQVYILRHNF